MNDLAATKTITHSFHPFDSASQLHTALAETIVARLASAVANKGRASIVVPGGTTPGPLYDVLSLREAPWEKVTVTLSDERWTAPEAAGSNEHLTRTRLIRDRAAALRLVPFKTAHDHAREAEAEVGAAVAKISRPFDVVLLGMGLDGHIASLIPGARGLECALDLSDPALVRAVEPADLESLGERMTLTLRAMLDASWIVLLIRGEAKLAAYHNARNGRDRHAMPVRALLQQGTVPLAVYWSA